MPLKTYTTITRTDAVSKQEVFVRRQWNGPRGKNIVGSFKRMARLMWDRQRFGHPFGSNPKKQGSVNIAAPAVAAT